jgi:hypothetical protein
MQISPEQLAKVKQTLNVAAPTGKPTMGSTAKKVQQTTAMAGGRPVSVNAQPSAGFPGSGTSAKLGEVAITGEAKGPEFSTFKMNTIYKVGGKGYDAKQLELAHKKILSTYGEDSDENNAFLSALGIGASPGSLKTFMKPDLRKDSKSYTDTAQVEYSGGLPVVNYTERTGQGLGYKTYDRAQMDIKDMFNKLINQFGIKETRALSNDPEARRK